MEDNVFHQPELPQTPPKKMKPANSKNYSPPLLVAVIDRWAAKPGARLSFANGNDGDIMAWMTALAMNTMLALTMTIKVTMIRCLLLLDSRMGQQVILLWCHWWIATNKGSQPRKKFRTKNRNDRAAVWATLPHFHWCPWALWMMKYYVFFPLKSNEAVLQHPCCWGPAARLDSPTKMKYKNREAAALQTIWYWLHSQWIATNKDLLQPTRKNCMYPPQRNQPCPRSNL